MSTCLVHLLDLEWQDYDHALLAELQLPEFLLHSAISEFPVQCLSWLVHGPLPPPESSSCEERVVVEKFDRSSGLRALEARYYMSMLCLYVYRRLIATVRLI